MKPEVILLKNFLLLEKDWSFALFMPSTDWLRPMHIVEVNLLCSRFTALNISVKVLVAQSCPTLCDPPWTVAHQALQSVGFSRQEYGSGLPFPQRIFPMQ